MQRKTQAYKNDIIEHEDAVLPPRSQFDILTGSLKIAAENISPSIFELPYVELTEKVSPTILVRRLKKRFWQEHDRVIANQEADISPTNIFGGLCSRQYFYKEVVDRPWTLAWILYPTAGYDAIAEEALDFGIERVRAEILTAPLYNEKGKFDVAVSAQIIQAIRFLDARVKGSPLQRIEQKSLHLHAHSDSKAMTREQLDLELKEIRDRLSQGAAPLLLESSDEEAT
jgi:hypothetical protein